MNHLLTILTVVFFISGSCEATDQTTETNNTGITEKQFENSTITIGDSIIQLVHTKNILFDCSINRPDKNKGLNQFQSQRQLSCKLTNKNAFTVYLLFYTCSDLPGPVLFTPDQFTTWQTTHCNVSWPAIASIEADSTIRFTTNLESNKGFSKPNKVGIYVKFVDRFIDLETLKQHPGWIQQAINTPSEKGTFLQSTVR